MCCWRKLLGSFRLHQWMDESTLLGSIPPEKLAPILGKSWEKCIFFHSKSPFLKSRFPNFILQQIFSVLLLFAFCVIAHLFCSFSLYYVLAFSLFSLLFSLNCFLYSLIKHFRKMAISFFSYLLCIRKIMLAFWEWILFKIWD